MHRVPSVIGQTIGRYRILERLGSGATGTVYKAFDESLERDVAIKALNRDLAEPTILNRFRVEATTLAKLNHPAIASVYDFIEYDGELLIVLEFVQGETLEALAERTGPLPVARAIAIVDIVLSALAHTHRAGIAHCDIKPANVMITAHGAVKIMDFGTARVQGAETGAAPYLLGTPAYMPPEQLLGQVLDGRTDLYAVGVLLYRLVTGALPFSAGNAIDAMRKQISDAHTPMYTHRPNLPDWCDRVMQRALAKRPADRFQTADEFRNALSEVTTMTTLATPAPRVSSWQRAHTRALRPLIAATAVAVSILAMGIVQAPPAPPMGDVVLEVEAEPPELQLPSPETRASSPVAEPEKNFLKHVPPFAFDARVLAGSRHSMIECKCRVELADGRILWRSADERQPHAVAFDRVAAMVYSHGRDPLWMGSSGPTPVVEVSHGPLGAFGLFKERDWVSLRLTESRLRFVVLRFDEASEAKDAISALEARVGIAIERVSKRRS